MTININELQETNEEAARILEEFETLEICVSAYKQNDGKYHIFVDGERIGDDVGRDAFDEPEQAVNCLSGMLATAKFILGQDSIHINYMRQDYEKLTGGE